MSGDARRLPLYLSAPHDCSYLPGRQSSTLFVDPAAPLDMAIYSELLHYGFRRSGSIIYAPRCEGCSQCVSARIPVTAFSVRRSQRRVRKKNADLEIIERPAAFDPAHYALYQRYARTRHADGEMANATAEAYRSFLCADWCDTTFLEFRLGHRLVAVAVTDRPTDGLSAVYTFFEPDLAGRSLGSYAILSQIAWARSLGLPYLYLGYWVRDCRKMAYKVDFRPIELFIGGRWRTIGSDNALPA